MNSADESTRDLIITNKYNLEDEAFKIYQDMQRAKLELTDDHMMKEAKRIYQEINEAKLRR